MRAAALLILLAPSHVSDVVDEIATSGRVVDSVQSLSDHLGTTPSIAPGAPPSLKFRYYDANERGRFGDVGLMVDDAGH